MYNCLSNNKFPEFRKRILENASSHDYNTRHREQLNPPFERLEICRRSFLCKGIGLWNNLDVDVNSRYFNYFKKTMKCKLVDGNV